MRRRSRRGLIGLVLVLPTVVSGALLTSPASAFPKGDPVYKFKYNVIATAHVAKADLTLSPPPGIFKGGIDLATGQLLGSITLPNTTFTQSEAGIGLVTATAAIVPVKQVTGHVSLGNFKVTATSVFNIHILTMYLATPTLPPLPITLPPLPIGLPISLPPVALPPVNLVGNSCTTASPISVTMSGIAHLDGPSTFSGAFSLPNFQSCGLMTAVINREIPGPGNTFSATATPSK
jgi:hypothetical protein